MKREECRRWSMRVRRRMAEAVWFCRRKASVVFPRSDRRPWPGDQKEALSSAVLLFHLNEKSGRDR